MNSPREVTGWRFDYMTPYGWHPWSEISMHTLKDHGGYEHGWYTGARAVCLHNNHTPPAKYCTCGYYCVTEMSGELAQQLDWLDAERDVAIESTGVRADWFAITLSRVTLTDAVPGRPRSTWAPGDDPPGTMRGHRIRFEHIMVDREWPAISIPQDENLQKIGFPAPEYVPNLAEWVRAKGAAEIDAILDDHFEGQP